MATFNGPWVNGGRIEWFYNVNTPAVGATSTTYSVTAYFRTEWNQQFINSGSKSWSGQWGSGSGHQAYALGNQGRLTLVSVSNSSISVQASARNVTFTATANHFFGTTSHTLTVSIPAYRPITASTPYGLGVFRAGDSANLAWFRSGSTTSVHIDRRTNGGAWSRLASPTGNITSYADSTITPGNKYDYRVRGVHEAGVSGWSNVASLTWTLSSPHSLNFYWGGTPTEFPWRLEWQRNYQSDETRIERRVNGWTWEQIASIGGAATSYNTGGLVQGNRYEYRVRDVVKGVPTAYSNIASLEYSPVAPTSVTVARSSDTQHTINIVGGSVRTSLVIHRQENDGAWVSVGTPVGNVLSWTDTTTRAARKYRYRVAIVTHGGQSGWVHSSVFYTTPAAVTSLYATRQGADILVHVTGFQSYYTDYEVQDDGVTVDSGIPPAVNPWRHNSPSTAVTHRYRARARIWTATSNGSFLFGGWSPYSNIVQLAAAPNPPMGLTPNGLIAPVGTNTVFRWQHNPVDSSEQSAYELRYRLNSGAWTTLSGTTAESRSVALPVGSFEWQVRTKGVHASFSDWSAVAAFTIIDLPVVTVTNPDTLLDRPTILVEWGYAQAQARPQSSWQLELLRGSERISSRSGTGAVSSVTLDTRAVDGEVYTVRVRAATGTVWGLWATSTFDVSYLPPADPVGFGSWNETDGVVGLTVRPGDDEGAPETVQLSVERSVDGMVWEPIFLGGAGTHTFSDGESLSSGTTFYRFTSFTFDGVTAATLAEVESGSGALWLSAGEGFLTTARLPYDPQVGLTPWRERGRLFFDGRPKAVAYAGEHHATGISGSGMIIEGEWPEAVATVNALEALFLDPAPIHLYRDPDGRRRYGIIDGSINRVSHGVWEFSFTVEETDRR